MSGACLLVASVCLLTLYANECDKVARAVGPSFDLGGEAAAEDPSTACIYLSSCPRHMECCSKHYTGFSVRA